MHRDCVLDGTRGLCGDQGYLDEWPKLYERVMILQHKGAGLAPWNIEQYELSARESVACVDGAPLIFYHYHAFRWLGAFLGRALVVPSLGYDFTPRQLRLIYRPYVAALATAERSARATKAGARLPQPCVGGDEKGAWRRWRISARVRERSGGSATGSCLAGARGKREFVRWPWPCRYCRCNAAVCGASGSRSRSPARHGRAG